MLEAFAGEVEKEFLQTEKRKRKTKKL